MKQLLPVAALIAASFTPAGAQTPSAPAIVPQKSETIARPNDRRDGKTPEERAAKDANHAEKQLGLNADQKIKWREASLARINANAPLKEKMRMSADDSEKRSLSMQMRDNAKKFDETVNGFLTADQKVKWVQVKQERKNARKNKKNHSTGQQPEPVQQE